MTRFALRNPIAVLMACIALIVFSAVATPRLNVDTFPELSPPALIVGTVAPGLGPRDVEKTISWRLEKYVGVTPGVERIQSISRSNLSILYIWLDWGTDLTAAQMMVQQQAAFAMANVPKSLGIIPPFVLQFDPADAPVLQIAISGGNLEGAELYDLAVNEIGPVIESLPGVASASPNGGRARQINVLVDPIRAQARGLTSSDVASAVRRTNALLPSGKFVTPLFDANLFTNAVPDSIDTIADTVIKEIEGAPVLIRDIATVEDGASPQTQSVTINGVDGVYLNVLRVPNGNTIDIVEGVKQAISDLDNLPPGLEVVPVFDQSTFVRATYEGLKHEILQALVLVSIVILVFLQQLRGVLIAAVSIPIAFAAILLVLYATGQTLNAFTLGGLTLSMGPLVDISVVVLESIHRKRAAGLSPSAAASTGAQEVAKPVLATTMTMIAVLLPVVLLAGLAQKLFVPLAITVAVAMIAGYVVSLTVTPVACRYFLGEKPPGRIAARMHHAVQWLADRYRDMLVTVLPRRKLVVGCVGLLIAATFMVAKNLPSTFFPEIDESMERIFVRMAPGTSIEDSSAMVESMGRILIEELPENSVRLMLTNVGSPKSPRSAMNSPNPGPHMGFIRLALVEPEHRMHSQREIADLSREILGRSFPGIEFQQAPGGLVAAVFSNGFAAPLVVTLRGRRLEHLDLQARAVAEVMRAVPGVRDVRTSLELDYPEVRVDLDRATAGMVGIDARAVGQTTLEATYGNINAPDVWVDPKNGQSYYVVTALAAEAVPDIDALQQVPVHIAANGIAIPLRGYASVERATGPVEIQRSQLERTVYITATTEGRDIGTAATEIEERLRSEPATAGLDFEFSGQIGLMRNTFSGLALAIGLAIMLVYMIMATQFHSLRLPIAMLFTIPGTLAGVVIALLYADQGFSVTALMGVLMVIGISAANGILMVDSANQRTAEGMHPEQAILEGARVRFVPILMTSLATIAGLLPMAMQGGATASNQPLALAVVGGLSSSLLLSLFVVPSMYLLLVGRTPAPPKM